MLNTHTHTHTHTHNIRACNSTNSYGLKPSFCRCKELVVDKSNGSGLNGSRKSCIYAVKRNRTPQPLVQCRTRQIARSLKGSVPVIRRCRIFSTVSREST
jgi:hypothetical protein